MQTEDQTDLYPPERERAQPTGPRPGSWIIRERAAPGHMPRAVAETFDEGIANRLRPHYDVVPVLQHLQELNTHIKETAHARA